MPDQSPQIKLAKHQISENVSVSLQSNCLSPAFRPKQYQAQFFQSKGELYLPTRFVDEEFTVLSVKRGYHA